nr:MAG: hypothetical protein DIU60_00920 [Actinomycetota bacterium]
MGSCDYRPGSFRLRLSIHVRDPMLSPAEFVEQATQGRGRAIDGLGDIAALATLDDGFATLMVAHDILLLTLTGTAAYAHGFP